MARRKSSSRYLSVKDRIRAMISNMVKSAWIAIVALALTLIALNHLGTINWVLDSLGRGHIAEANAVFIHKSKVAMAETILTLTGLDTGLEVLKSSSAGISFIAEVEVQVGNIVITIQEAAHKALYTSLIAASSFVAIELLLDIANLFSVPVVTLSIIVTGVHFVTRHHMRWVANVSGQLSEILILLTFFIHFGLPLTVYGSAYISQTITDPIKAEARAHFKRTQKDFPHAAQEKLNDHVKDVIKRYKQTSESAHTKGRLLSHSVTRYVTAVLFDAFAFPAIIALIVVWVIRVMIRHALRIKELIEAGGMQDAVNLQQNKR